MPISAGNFRVTNEKGDITFNVKERLLSFHSRHVLLDAAGNTIATLKKKIFGVDQRRQVYKRDSSDPDDVVFSATQFKTGELNVVLGHKKEKNTWDFKVVGSWLERSCIVYNHLTAIALVQKKHMFRCVMKRRDILSVTMSPNVNHSSVVGLVVILDRINDGMDDLIASCIWIEI